MPIFKYLSDCAEISKSADPNVFEQVNVFEKICVPADKRVIVCSTVPTGAIDQDTCCVVIKPKTLLFFPDSSKIKEYDGALYQWVNGKKHFNLFPKTDRKKLAESFHPFYKKRLDKDSIMFMSKFLEPEEDVLDRIIFIQQKSSFGMGFTIDELPIIRLPKQLNHIMISFTKDGKQRVYLQFSTL